MRDIDKTVANAKIPGPYQLRCSEWIQLANEARAPYCDAPLDATLKAFKYGFVLGQRAQKKAMIKKK